MSGVRRGLVLGAGGLLGFTWIVAALYSYEQAYGVDARDAEISVGTSAGSVVAALLGRGVSVETMLRHQRGCPRDDDPSIDWDYDIDSGGALPPRPGFGIGSPRLAGQVLRHPRRLPTMAALTSFAPPGRGTFGAMSRMIGGLGGVGWPGAPTPWLVAFDYDAGRRVAFGRTGDPIASLPDAVVASCSIPGWYAPVLIDGSRYIDGGTWSPASLDLLAGAGLDEVLVLAPMASFAYDQPRSLVAKAERRFRRALTRRLLSEAAPVRAAGTRVTMLAPGPEDLARLGVNLMNPTRRISVLDTALRTTAAAFAQPLHPVGR
jgi:NTE family protein